MDLETLLQQTTRNSIAMPCAMPCCRIKFDMCVFINCVFSVPTTHSNIFEYRPINSMIVGWLIGLLLWQHILRFENWIRHGMKRKYSRQKYQTKQEIRKMYWYRVNFVAHWKSSRNSHIGKTNAITKKVQNRRSEGEKTQNQLQIHTSETLL